MKYKFKYDLPDNLSFSISKKDQTDDLFIQRLDEIQNKKNDDQEDEEDEEDENEL